jgi:hypothetical protein
MDKQSDNRFRQQRILLQSIPSSDHAVALICTIQIAGGSTYSQRTQRKHMIFTQAIVNVMSNQTFIIVFVMFIKNLKIKKKKSTKK